MLQKLQIKASWICPHELSLWRWGVHPFVGIADRKFLVHDIKRLLKLGRVPVALFFHRSFHSPLLPLKGLVLKAQCPFVRNHRRLESQNNNINKDCNKGRHRKSNRVADEVASVVPFWE